MLGFHPIAAAPLAAIHPQPAGGMADAYAIGLLALIGQAVPPYQAECTATGLLALTGQAEALEVTGGWVNGRLNVSGSAVPTYQWACMAAGLLRLTGSAAGRPAVFCAAPGRLDLHGQAPVAPSWYTPTPLVGGGNGLRAAWGDLPRHDHLLTAPHREAEIIENSGSIPWGELEELDPRNQAKWRDTPRLETDLELPHADLTDHQDGETGMGYAHPASKGRDTFQVPWGDAMLLYLTHHLAQMQLYRLPVCLDKYLIHVTLSFLPQKAVLCPVSILRTAKMFS